MKEAHTASMGQHIECMTSPIVWTVSLGGELCGSTITHTRICIYIIYTCIYIYVYEYSSDLRRGTETSPAATCLGVPLWETEYLSEHLPISSDLAECGSEAKLSCLSPFLPVCIRGQPVCPVMPSLSRPSASSRMLQGPGHDRHQVIECILRDLLPRNRCQGDP